MTAEPLRGVYPILITPFMEDGQIDEEGLRRLIDFDIEAGVHGLGVALGSEIFKLSEAERDHVTRVVVDQVDGRVPVVINTGAAGTDLAVFYSRRAQENGADALMIMPPAFMPAIADEVRDYFRAISAAVQIPIFLQDTPSAIISPGLARQIAEECEWVRYIKVESQPITAKVADMVEKSGDLLTVFGGAGGGYFIEEMRRGSVGTMPFCSQPEAFVGVWDLFHAGDEAAARELFDRVIMPVNRIAAQGSGIFYTVHKELLRRRGVIRTAKVRSPAPPVEALTLRELDQLIDQLYPLNS
ncbi:MAG: dihydrodipicolinate synthase family protein [Caldilineaceae bacterium]|nr:dihydrodipicolinate synthase family protein [Caldilineaceae bacterium]